MFSGLVNRVRVDLVCASLVHGIRPPINKNIGEWGEPAKPERISDTELRSQSS